MSNEQGTPAPCKASGDDGAGEQIAENAKSLAGIDPKTVERAKAHVAAMAIVNADPIAALRALSASELTGDASVEAAYRAGWAQASVDPVFRGTVDAGWQEWNHYRQYLLTAALATPKPPVDEPWPGYTADQDKRRVVTLAKLGLMLFVMAGGEAPEVTGFDAADLYGEVLMALGIEDAEDEDIALQVARDDPESHMLTGDGAGA